MRTAVNPRRGRPARARAARVTTLAMDACRRVPRGRGRPRRHAQPPARSRRTRASSATKVPHRERHQPRKSAARPSRLCSGRARHGAGSGRTWARSRRTRASAVACAAPAGRRGCRRGGRGPGGGQARPRRRSLILVVPFRKVVLTFHLFLFKNCSDCYDLTGGGRSVGDGQ